MKRVGILDKNYHDAINEQSFMPKYISLRHILYHYEGDMYVLFVYQ